MERETGFDLIAIDVSSLLPYPHSENSKNSYISYIVMFPIHYIVPQNHDRTY